MAHHLPVACRWAATAADAAGRRFVSRGRHRRMDRCGRQPL